MGLVARVIEQAGVSTVVHSWIPEMPVSVGAPRVVGIAYPGSVPFGPPGDARGQRAVLHASLTAAAAMTAPGARSDLGFEWPSQMPVTRPPRQPPITRAIVKQPWLYARLLNGDVP